MRIGRLLALGVVVALSAGTLYCELSEDGCTSAENHLCSNLPDMGCSVLFMDNAVEKVRSACGDKADAFFIRAQQQCVRGQKMNCPTD